MRELWRLLRTALTTDDLVWRVTFLLFAILLASLTAGLSYWLLTADGRSSWWVWQLLLWALAVGLAIWSIVLLGGCFGSPGSRWARWAHRVPLDAADGEGVILLLAIILIPAAALTLMLRWIGVRGHSSNQVV